MLNLRLMATESTDIAVSYTTTPSSTSWNNTLEEVVTLKGWLYNIRSSGKILFHNCEMERVWSNALL